MSISITHSTDAGSLDSATGVVVTSGVVSVGGVGVASAGGVGVASAGGVDVASAGGVGVASAGGVGVGSDGTSVICVVSVAGVASAVASFLDGSSKFATSAVNIQNIMNVH